MDCDRGSARRTRRPAFPRGPPLLAQRGSFPAPGRVTVTFGTLRLIALAVGARGLAAAMGRWPGVRRVGNHHAVQTWRMGPTSAPAAKAAASRVEIKLSLVVFGLKAR